MPANSNVNSQSSESGAAYRLDSAYENDVKNWTKVPGKEGFPEYSVYLAPIQKSASDDRSYRIVKLSNGLEAVLVQDAATDKAAASLDVAVGHLSDPVSSNMFNLSLKRSEYHGGLRASHFIRTCKETGLDAFTALQSSRVAVLLSVVPVVSPCPQSAIILRPFRRD